MQQTSEPLFSELNRLKKIYAPLRDRLAEAGRQFHDSAVPLPENLVADLADFKKSVAELGSRVQEIGKKLSIIKDLPVADLDEIGRSLQLIAAAEPVFREKPQPVDVGVEASVEEAIRLASLCREQGKNSEADRIYQRLLEVPRNAGAGQSPQRVETLQGFAAAKAESIRPVPAQQASVPSGAVTAVEGDINQEIDAILDNISQLAAQTPAIKTAVAPPTALLAAKPTASLAQEEAPVYSTKRQSPPEFAQELHAHAEPISNRPHPLSVRPMFASQESSKPAFSRSMIFGGVALAGALAIAIFGYMTMRRPAETASPSSMPAAAEAAPVNPEPASQIQEQPQPTAAAYQAMTTQPPITQAPATTTPVSRPTAAPQSGSAPTQTAATQTAATQTATAPPVRVTVKPVQQPQSMPKANDITKPLVAQKDVPEPPRLVSGLSVPAVGSALGSLGNSVATLPPPPSAQEPLRVGGQLQAAKLIHITLPDYPAQFRQAHIQGTVRLEVVIKKDGTVGDLTVVSGNRFLNGPAIAAVKQWRYQPTLLNGEPVAVVTTVDVNFVPNQ